MENQEKGKASKRVVPFFAGLVVSQKVFDLGEFASLRYGTSFR